METSQKNIPDFHSGQRLHTIRKIKGYTQEGLLYEPDFPKVSLKTLRRWEQKGVNPLRLQEVASFFGLDLWGFIEDHIGEKEFTVLALHPELYQPIKAKHLYPTLQTQPTLATQNQKHFKILVDLIQLGQHQNFITHLGDFPLTYQGDQGWTLLHWAIHKNQLESIRHLLKQKNLNPNLGDKEGFTPLMCAAAWGYLECSKILLTNNCPPTKLDQLDYMGWSALTWACSNGHLAVAELLLSSACNPNLQDSQKTSPLHRAIQENNQDMVKLLITHGADQSIQNKQGETGMQLAKKLNYLDLLPLVSA